jgi:hypothetical protein
MMKRAARLSADGDTPGAIRLLRAFYARGGWRAVAMLAPDAKATQDAPTSSPEATADAEG